MEIDNFTKQHLLELQGRSLWWKVQRTAGLIMEWYMRHEGNVYISFSGGKDSTVLLHIARQFFPDIPAVFVDTGLEYPEIRQFALSKENVVRIRPKLSFLEVVKQYGYPVIGKEVAKKIYYFRKGSQHSIDCFNGVKKDGSASKFRERYKKYKYLTEAPFAISHYCCYEMKIYPLEKYMRDSKRKPIIGTMACESQQREAGWMKTGCNAFDGSMSKPLSFWLEQDVLRYLEWSGIPYSPVYGNIEPISRQLTLDGTTEGPLMTTGCDRTGCMFCCFGIMRDKTPNRFQRMKQTHPRQYEYCIGGGSYDDNGNFQPDNTGLGIGKVLDYLGIPY